MITFILPLVAFVLALGVWLISQLHPKNAPPGPLALPFVGNLLSDRPHETLREWKKKYGDTFRYSTGGKNIVVMNSLETIRKTFGLESSTGRDQNFTMTKLTKGHGLVFSQGAIWKEHRRFALTTLRDFGMGNTWFEDAILDEVDDMCQVLEKFNSSPVDPQETVNHSVSNVVCALVFGQRFQHSNKEFTRLTLLLSEMISLLRIDPIIQALPFLKYLPGTTRDTYRKLRSNYDELMAFFKKEVDEHKRRFIDGDVKNFIDAYIQEGKSQDEVLKAHTFDEAQLLVNLLDLFGGGTDTTSSTILWSVILMLEHPEVMRKVQKEIENVAGRDEKVRMASKGLLPFTEATILEVQRIRTILPFALYHAAMEDMLVDGFNVPKGTTLVANLHDVHTNPAYWKDPKRFDPTRFLDADGKITRPTAFMPFSIGKRACPGESLARMELFLFIANLFRRFDVELPKGVNTISHKDLASFSVIVAPKPFEIIFRPRK